MTLFHQSVRSYQSVRCCRLARYYLLVQMDLCYPLHLTDLLAPARLAVQLVLILLVLRLLRSGQLDLVVLVIQLDQLLLTLHQLNQLVR